MPQALLRHVQYTCKGRMPYGCCLQALRLLFAYTVPVNSPVISQSKL